MSRAHLEARVGFFVERGMARAVPSPWQVKVGWLAMLPVTLSESERERALSRRTWLGQVPIRVPLQLLYNPRQLVVDTGLTHRAGQTVRHLLSVFHEDAFLGYDLQLLTSHPGGLALLRREAQRVVDGRTAWATYLRRLVGAEGYHARLIALAEQAEELAYPDPRDLDPRFSSLTGFAAFCCEMPEWPEREFYGFDLARLARGPGEPSAPGSRSYGTSGGDLLERVRPFLRRSPAEGDARRAPRDRRDDRRDGPWPR